MTTGLCSRRPEHGGAAGSWSSSRAQRAVRAARVNRARERSPTVDGMCRNITELRGLEPPASDEEVEAAARQFVRKVSGIRHPPPTADQAFEAAVAEVTATVQRLLDGLPARRQPPATVPPLRRPEVRARLGR
jgi:hypothetical protein